MEEDCGSCVREWDGMGWASCRLNKRERGMGAFLRRNDSFKGVHPCLSDSDMPGTFPSHFCRRLLFLIFLASGDDHLLSSWGQERNAVVRRHERSG